MATSILTSRRFFLMMLTFYSVIWILLAFLVFFHFLDYSYLTGIMGGAIISFIPLYWIRVIQRVKRLNVKNNSVRRGLIIIKTASVFSLLIEVPSLLFQIYGIIDSNQFYFLNFIVVLVLFIGIISEQSLIPTKS
jgi:hypothetical protein